MSDKQYLSADQLLVDSFRLAERVFSAISANGDYCHLAGRGAHWYRSAGVSRVLRYPDIISRFASYDAHRQRLVIRVHGLNYLIKNVTAEDKLLIVDDVFDTGRTVDAVIERLTSLARLNTPADIRVAVPYYKPSRREVDRVPEYFLEETDAWLMYPHSLEGLSVEEIREHRPALYEIIKDRIAS